MVEIIVTMLGGLALFLYGMKMMSNGWELVAGNRMKEIIKNLCSNKFISVLVGCGVTALIQSSSATTVMLVTFVNSGIMRLDDAIWIIMGANIGATLTTQLTALDISTFANILAIAGVVMIVFVKRKKSNDIGHIVAGLGILFLGMGIMSQAVHPLREMPEFTSFMTTFENPIVGILGGAAFTALIQSSSAAIGILEAISMTGTIKLSSSIYLILGMNIGTCVTALFVSLGGNKDAKRTASLHLFYNVISALVFTILLQFVPFVAWMEATSASPKVQIANANTVYKICATIMLMPFGQYLVKLSRFLIRDGKEEKKSYFAEVNSMRMGSVSVAISSLTQETIYMLELVHQNLNRSLDALIEHDTSSKDELYRIEQKINTCRDEITKYMDQISTLELRAEDAEPIMAMFRMATDLERLGDHAKNFMGFAEEDELNAEAIEELKQFRTMLDTSFNMFVTHDMAKEEEAQKIIAHYEDQVDELTETYRSYQVDRLSKNKCSAMNCVVYTNCLVDIERCFDHVMNLLDDCKDTGVSLKRE